PLQGCRVTAEAESAAYGLKGSTLRLEVIELRVQIVAAEAERVSAFQPGKVRGTHVLIIAEQKRVPSVVIADIGPSGANLKRGNSTLEPIGPIRTRDFQNV